jgi:hypothetical protein
MDVLIERGADINIGKADLKACLRIPGAGIKLRRGQRRARGVRPGDLLRWSPASVTPVLAARADRRCGPVPSRWRRRCAAALPRMTPRWAG